MRPREFSQWRLFFTSCAVVAGMVTQSYAQDCNCGESSGAYVGDGCATCDDGCGGFDGGCATGSCASCGGLGLGNLLAPILNRNCGKSCAWNQPLTENSQPDVFFNVYAPNNMGNTAAAYPAPYPTPSLVGHTYYTYQPLMPHEFLYKHHRTYHQYYNGGMGMNRTTVHWYHNPIHSVLRGVRRTALDKPALFW